MRARDNRRQRLYDAERAATMPPSKAAVKHLHGGPKVRTTGNVSIEACQAYVDHVTGSAWFQRRWGRRQFTVEHKVYGAATGGYGRVTLPPWGRTEWVILHEVAHSLTPPGCAPHGPEFAAALLTLVRQQVGKAAYDSLRGQLRAHRFGRVAPLVKPDPGQVVTPRAKIEAAAARAARRQVEQQRTQAREARERLERRRRSYAARQEAAETIRLLVKDGAFGAAGSKSRAHALATARVLASQA